MADDIATSVVGTMLEPIRDSFYAFIRRRFGYLVHCRENIKDFEDEVEKLRDAMGRIQTRVDAALQNAEVIEDDVSRWLTEVQTSLPTMEEDSNRLQRGTQNLYCFDVCSRFRLGKEGKKKQPLVTKLIEDGSNFDSVSHRPLVTRTWHRTYTINYETFQSRELVFKEIMEALKDDSTYKIGIYGMPGVGKTRMMKEVAELAYKERLFDDIAETVVTQNPKLNKIQQKLAAGLNLTLDKEDEGASKELLHNRLTINGRKIFVMVDDVWDSEIKLEDIGIPATDDQTKGSKILLTSRRQDVCKDMGVPENYNFQIGVLSKAEARFLFEKKVGDSFESDEMRSVVEAVCEECAGLPLAILAVGGALMDKRKEVWEDALDQMRNSRADYIGGMPAKLYSRIELSYNYLQPVDAKSLFLLCCLFPEDFEIPIGWLAIFGFGMRLLRGVDTMKKARNRAHAMADTLKTSSLLLEGSEDEDSVKMHDIIRDVAISIASKEKDAMFLVRESVEKWPEEDEYKLCRAISLFFKDDCVLPDDLECPELRTLILVCNDALEVPLNFFKGMEKLEALILLNMHIGTLPSSLKNLRMLYLINCKLVNLAYLRESKKLELLTIHDSALEELAQEMKQLTHLRLLDLRNCYNLKILPSGIISSLSQLEELSIPDEFDQWEVKDNASLSELNSLRHLTSLKVHVPNVMLLPLNEGVFKSLIRFQISIGGRLDSSKIPSPTRKILKLKNIPSKMIVEILMEKAEVLYLFQLKFLNEVFHDTEGERFVELKYLEVDDCDGVEHLFGKPKKSSPTNGLREFGSFNKLSVLKVENCQSRYLFSTATARGLLQLRKLYIVNCEILKEIIRDDKEVMDPVTFHRLKKMKLERLPHVRSFYFNTTKTSTTRCNTSTHMQALFNDKVRFPALEKLEIIDLESLTAIWDNELFLGSEAEDSFWRLRSINVEECGKLVNVIPPNVLPLLQGLEILQVRNCDLVQDCDSVVSGVEVVAIEEDSDEMVVIPQLWPLLWSDSL